METSIDKYFQTFDFKQETKDRIRVMPRVFSPCWPLIMNCSAWNAIGTKRLSLGITGVQASLAELVVLGPGGHPGKSEVDTSQTTLVEVRPDFEMLWETLGVPFFPPSMQEEDLLLSRAGSVGRLLSLICCFLHTACFLWCTFLMATSNLVSSQPHPHCSLLFIAVFCLQWLLCFPEGKTGLYRSHQPMTVPVSCEYADQSLES